MGWTPHTKTELSDMGVQFGVPDSTTNGSVIIYPGSDGVTSTANRYYSTPFVANTGTSAKQSSQITGDLSTALGSVGDCFAEVPVLATKGVE